MSNTKTKKHPVIRGWKIFQYSVAGLVAIFLIVALALHFVFKWEYMIVSTGSMVGNQKDSLNVGTLAIARPIDFEDIKVGDIITKNVSGGNLTHRVVRIEYDENGKNLRCYTRGDAKAPNATNILYNDPSSEDENPITKDTVITGKVIMHSDFIGKIVYTKAGKIMALGIIVGVIGVFAIVSYILEKVFDDDEENEAVA